MQPYWMYWYYVPGYYAIPVYFYPQSNGEAFYQENEVRGDRKPPKKIVMAYYQGFSKNFPSNKFNGTYIDYLTYAFAKTTNGKVAIPGDKTIFENQMAILQRVKKRFPNMKTKISVGGWFGSEDFSDIALSPESRLIFANSAVDFMRKYKFDGLDVDWEYPVNLGRTPGRPEDKQDFTLLLKEMRNAFDEAGKKDGKHYVLSIAAGIGRDYLKNTDVSEVQKYVDWIGLMTYDYNGSWNKFSGHNAPLYLDPDDPTHLKQNVDESVQRFINAGVSPNKIVIGIPYYGRGWSSCNRDNFGEYQRCTTIPDSAGAMGEYTYDNLRDNYVNKKGFVRHWNNASKVPFLWNDKQRTFISYCDAQSIKEKANYIKQNNLKGAMVWEQKYNKDFSLTNQLARNLRS